MAWNGAGTYSRVHNWVADRDASIKIQATRMDAEDDSIAAGINACLTKNGENSPSANLPMGTKRHTGVGNASARTDYAAAGQVQDGGLIWGGTAGGTADAITITLSPAITAYAAGQTFAFISSGANTTAVTLNINGVGAKAVTKDGTTALIAGDIPNAAIIEVTYDGTRFQLQTPGNLASTGVANNFTANQTITLTDAGSGEGPSLTLDRNSSSPATSDIIGLIRFNGRDSGAATQNYGTIHATILDPTAGSEDADLRFQTVVGGNIATKLRIFNGIFTAGATGGDKGANTINASAFYDDGVQIVAGLPAPDFTSSEQTVTVDTLLNVAHGLGAVPTLTSVILRCKTADIGYSVGDEVSSETVENGIADRAVTIASDSTNVSIIQGALLVLLNKSTFNGAGITASSWKWVVRAWK